MEPATLIAALALLMIISLAASYIIREKKRGVKCIGCPYAGSCQKQAALRKTVRSSADKT